MKRGIILLFAVMFASPAAYGIISFGIEPIVGYERTQLWVPYRHTKDRLVYGARVTAGILLISGEGELTRADSTESFPDIGLSTKDTDYKAKLGLRSTVRLLGVVYGFARAGGQATLRKHEDTRNGVTVKYDDTLKVKPYAGAGVRGRLGKFFEVFGDLTVVFAQWPKFDHNEYQAMAGFSVRFP
jgi:hypothetical protein